MLRILLLGLAMQVPSYPSQYLTPGDPRIQRLVFDANQVYPLAVGRGYALVIDLGPDQVVESIVVGNRVGWDVSASKRGDSVVVKPLEGAATTDMVVITESRRYVFLIQAVEQATAFVVSFTPQAAAPVFLSASPPRTDVPSDFRMRGDKSLFPIAMRATDLRTTITWGRDTELPAIFAIDNGRESIVNGRMVGGDYVIEGAAMRYVFRLGKAQASATRRRIQAKQ